MRPLNEDQMIDYMARALPAPSNTLGIGDDAAIGPWTLSTGERIVMCCDALNEGVHFRSDVDPFDLGYKSLAVNLSDIAAMGAKPVGALLSVSLRSDLDFGWWERFSEGFATLAHRYNVTLFGGDTTRSLHTSLTVTAIGTVRESHIKKRDGAKQGDRIVVSGFLGNAAGGLKALFGNSQQALPSLLTALHRPDPEVATGQWLGQRPEVTSMIDVSDGLVKDLGRVCRAAKVGAEIAAESLPLSSDLQAFCRHENQDPLSLALFGGEDYVLLATITAEAAAPLIHLAKTAGILLYEIGKVTAGNSVVITRSGETWTPSISGFEHFSAGK